MKEFMIASVIMIALIVFSFAAYDTANKKAVGEAGYDGHTLTHVATPNTRLPVRRPVKSYDLPQVVNSHEVVYKIITTDCMTFDVTYEMPGGTSQKSVNACPSKNVVDHLTAKRGDFLYLSAQNTMDVYAGYTQKPFSCYISVDGEAVATVQSTGFASIASCHGRVP